MDDFLKPYRKKFRRFKKGVRLKLEQRKYERVFKSRNLSVPDNIAIRKAILSKFPDVRPRQKGSLVIVAVYKHYNWENESLKPSLEKFGTVLHYDWSNRLNNKKGMWNDSIKSQMNRDLIKTLSQWCRRHPVDVIFTYLSGENVTPATVQKMSSLGIPMVNMYLNDKENFVGKAYKGLALGTRDIGRYFDLCWTSTEDAIKKYCVEGSLPIYLPEGANPDLHKPYEIAKTIDVSFVGQCYGYRPKVVERLKRRGFHIEAYGHGWPNGPLTVGEMIRTYSRSKINLGFGGVGDLLDSHCLKGRDFEVPMSGGLYLTEYNPELASCYDLGKEIVSYVDFEDLVNKIKFLLSNPEEAERIRKRGFLRARSEHSWEMRFEKIFRLFGLIETQAPTRDSRT